MNNISFMILMGLLGVAVVGVFILLYFFIRAKHKSLSLATSMHEIENNLLYEQHRFETVFDHANTGLALLSLDGQFLKVNKAICDLLGYNDTEMAKMNYCNLIHLNDVPDFRFNMQQLMDNEISVYQSEHQCFRKSNDSVWIMATITLIPNNITQHHSFILQMQDISLQKRAEERLRHMAYHDPLTGLANRHKLEDFITHLLASARRHQQNFALVFLDLDRFKNVNDTIGHEAGDLLLQIIAERLLGAVRESDMVARLGGDEFVVLVTDVKKTESVALIAQKILSNVMQAMVIKGQEIYITTSIGISLYPFDGQTMQALMKNADLALYRAKEQGRNNYQFYTLEMTSKAQGRLTLQNALGHSLVKNEFLLNYQPRMGIKTRKITGIEALLRWQNKDFGGVTPDEIISLVEDNGLIIPVSQWIVKTACKQLKTWHDLGLTSLTIAVNCSIRQIKHATFVDELLETLNECGLSPSSLEIEIKESTIMQDPENTLRILYTLRDLGVQISIDNFGTGYWSLSNLKRLAVDKIKIDKSFIKQIAVDETSTAIISAFIAMVNRLNIISVAEGVETREQYEFLAAEGCREIQGYYLTPPLSAEAMTQFLERPVPDLETVSRSDSFTSP